MSAEKRVARALCGSIVLASLFLADVGQGVRSTPAGTEPTLETARTACSAATKKRRQRALAAFKRQAPKQRKAYFKKHRSPKLRKAYSRKQQAKLKALQRALAACRARPPAPPTLPPAAPTPIPPAPPPAPPPPAPEPELPPQAGAPCSPALAQNEQARQLESNLGMPMFNEGPLNPAGLLPPAGHVDALVIPVDFADAPAQEDAAQIAAQITSELGWFAEGSNGRFAVSATVLPRWYRMPEAASSYPAWHSREGGHRLLSDATAAVDPEVAFSKHTFVFVLVPPSFPQRGNPAWSVFPGYGVSRDGVELRHATFMTNRSPYTANHEFTHSLGVPDLYLLNESTGVADFTLVGNWDPMSAPGPRHLLGWHKWQLRWIDADQIACLGAPGSLTAHVTPIAQPGGVKIVVVPTSASTAYVVEARASAGRESGLCKEGVLVYSVDSQVRNGQGPVRVRRQSEDPALNHCGLLHAAPFTPGTAYEDDAIRVEVFPPLRSGIFHVNVTRK
jgi:M6 family metalloprotease-like protein